MTTQRKDSRVTAQRTGDTSPTYEPPTVRVLGPVTELTLGKKAHVPDQLGGTNPTPPGFGVS